MTPAPIRATQSGQFSVQYDSTHNVILLQLLRLHPPLSMPETHLKPLSMRLNLMLPLHERNHRSNDQARLSPWLGQHQSDGLDTELSAQILTKHLRLAHSHLVGKHTTLPFPLFLLLHPVQALLLEGEECEFQGWVRFHRDGFDWDDLILQITPNIFELLVVLRKRVSEPPNGPSTQMHHDVHSHMTRR